MPRGEITANLLRESGNKGMTTAEIEKKTGLMDGGKAVCDAKEWLYWYESLTSRWEKSTFFGFFPRRQKRYFITNTRS